MEHVNPFRELFVTEKSDPEQFVKLISPILIEHALPIYTSGNVALLGGSGCGKTTLLHFLMPEIRLAYDRAGIDFPVPQSLRAFVSAGINLAISDALGIGERPITNDKEMDEQLYPLYFGDLLNCWIVDDFLKSMVKVSENRTVFELTESSSLDEVASGIAELPCWFGCLHGCKTIKDIRNRLQYRTSAYFSYAQFNSHEIPEEISSSKTRPGRPISETAKYLKEIGYLNSKASIFIRIDQMEQLAYKKSIRPKFAQQCRQVINSMLGGRDPHVSYKLGIRRYAWEHDMCFFASESMIERDRDYSIVDLDDMLRRGEDRKTWIFPKLATDVFWRRLAAAGLISKGAAMKPHVQKRLFKQVFGDDELPEIAAKRYANAKMLDDNKIKAALYIDSDWPSHWQSFLINRFKDDPLDAKLAAAWVRQGARRNNRLLEPIPNDCPWTKTYWRKERVRLALAQLASSCQQRLEFAGKTKIMSLSVEGILLFVAVCQHIFDAQYQRDTANPSQSRADIVKDGIHPSIQSTGIHNASKNWLHRTIQAPGGTDRLRFVYKLGNSFQTALLSDRSMTYPGHNGFSIANEDLESFPELQGILRQAVDHGALDSRDHTTKDIDRRQRTKWYLNPVFSPFFRIPESHPKEPMYCSAENVLALINGKVSRITPNKSVNDESSADDSSQLSFI